MGILRAHHSLDQDQKRHKIFRIPKGIGRDLQVRWLGRGGLGAGSAGLAMKPEGLKIT
jgi:hypothetical protein